jgi:hypothetical protein
MNKLSPKKQGTVRIYIRPKIGKNPWLRYLNGERTTKTLLARADSQGHGQKLETADKRPSLKENPHES